MGSIFNVLSIIEPIIYYIFKVMDSYLLFVAILVDFLHKFMFHVKSTGFR